VDKGTKRYHLYNNDGNRIELEQSDGEKDIGVFVDENLSFNKQEHRAQDTTLWYPTCDMMAFGLSAIYNYFLCSVVKKIFYPLNYFLTYFIEQSDGEKDIGVFVDENFSFNKHIQNQVNKANSIMGLIRRTYAYLDEQSLSKSA
jgi:hypothetical protein